MTTWSATVRPVRTVGYTTEMLCACTAQKRDTEINSHVEEIAEEKLHQNESNVDATFEVLAGEHKPPEIKQNIDSGF